MRHDERNSSKQWFNTEYISQVLFRNSQLALYPVCASVYLHFWFFCTRTNLCTVKSWHDKQGTGECRMQSRKHIKPKQPYVNIQCYSTMWVHRLSETMSQYRPMPAYPSFLFHCHTITMLDSHLHSWGSAHHTNICTQTTDSLRATFCTFW